MKRTPLLSKTWPTLRWLRRYTQASGHSARKAPRLAAEVHFKAYWLQQAVKELHKALSAATPTRRLSEEA